MAYSDARNERERAAGDTSGRSSGGGGDRARQAEARNREAMARGGSRGTGGNRLAGNATVADHMIATGRISAPSIPAGGVAQGNYPTQDDAYTDYAKAVGKHATRGFIDKALDWIGGGWYDPQEPMAGNPRSFAGGDYHSTSNPGSSLGGLLGTFAGPAGAVVGPLMGSAYTGLGLPDVWHGGYDQPDLRTGLLGNTDNPMGGTMADIGSGHTYSSGNGGPSYASNPATGGGTGNSNGLLNPNFGAPTTPPQTATAPKTAAPQVPMDLYKTLQAQYMPINAKGLAEYGVWRPQHTYAA